MSEVRSRGRRPRRLDHHPDEARTSGAGDDAERGQCGVCAEQMKKEQHKQQVQEVEPFNRTL